MIPDDLEGLIPNQISMEENVVLCSIPQVEEIQAAVWGIDSFKSPGPDGMSGLLYKQYWDTVGADVVEMVRDFFRRGYMFSALNHSFVMLIPKNDHPIKIGHYQPISLCNMAYKIISKILANRLKLFLPRLISPLQSAFVQGRVIQENSILTHEVFHMLKNKRKGRHYVAIRADFEKAYDRMEWLLIIQALHCFGFHPTFVHWVYQCMSSVSYSILLNGSPYGFFKPMHGLRQGDPISPLLFILGSQMFSFMLSQAESQGRIHGIRIGRGVQAISHLLYADDLLIFCIADLAESQVIADCLNLFGNWSGQRLNARKSSIIFSRSTSASIAQNIYGILHLSRKDHVEKHLGLPVSIDQNKNIQFKVLYERVKNRFESWQMRTLSQAGISALIKSVASALPAYTMNLFLLPKSLCHRLDSMLMRFWWGFRNDGHHHLYLKSWASICQPNASGGLGFKLMWDLNRAQLTKLAWMIQSDTQKFWVQIIRAKYLKTNFVWDTKAKPASSWFWRGISRVAHFLQASVGFLIGNGDATKVWSDSWILNPQPHPLSLVGTLPIETLRRR